MSLSSRASLRKRRSSRQAHSLFEVPASEVEPPGAAPTPVSTGYGGHFGGDGVALGRVGRHPRGNPQSSGGESSNKDGMVGQGEDREDHRLVGVEASPGTGGASERAEVTLEPLLDVVSRQEDVGDRTDWDDVLAGLAMPRQQPNCRDDNDYDNDEDDGNGDGGDEVHVPRSPR